MRQINVYQLVGEVTVSLGVIGKNSLIIYTFWGNDLWVVKM
jgi:hypothetical protein